MVPSTFDEGDLSMSKIAKSHTLQKIIWLGFRMSCEQRVGESIGSKHKDRNKLVKIFSMYQSGSRFIVHPSVCLMITNDYQ